MKKVSILVRSALAVCFAFVMSSASCDLFDKVDDVNINVEFSQLLTVNETASAENVDYQLYKTLDANGQNSDFDKYKDKIKSITITSITYVIENCETEGVTLTDGVVGFSATTAADPTKVATIGVENICAAQGQTNTLVFDQAALDQLASILQTDKKANIFVKGKLNHTPAKFNVNVHVAATVVADAL